MNNKTIAEHTIDVLRTLFSSLGLPNQIISDDGPQFTSEAPTNSSVQEMESAELLHHPIIPDQMGRQNVLFRLSRMP